MKTFTAKLMPFKKTASNKPPRGSCAAVLESLKYTSSFSDKDLQELSYKELRARAMQAKYGDGQIYKRLKKTPSKTSSCHLDTLSEH